MKQLERLFLKHLRNIKKILDIFAKYTILHNMETMLLKLKESKRLYELSNRWYLGGVFAFVAANSGDTISDIEGIIG